MPSTSSVPEVAGVRVAYRRRTGLTGKDRGGDWSDSVRLPGNRLVLVVGDVLDGGLPAHTVADQFRSAARVLTQMDLSPAQVLHRLDVLAESLGDEYTSTCVYVSCDLADGTAVFASAGHLPPLLRTPYDPAYRVALPVGPPLGVGGGTFEERQYTIPPGSLLALYTDGLLGHALGEDADAAIAELGRLLDKAEDVPDDQLDHVCEHISDVMLGTGGEHIGDATLVLAKLGRLPDAAAAAWTLTARPTAVAQARDLIRDRLLAWGLHGLADVVELLVSELVTNALRYGIAPFGLRMTRDAANIMVEVSDGNPTVPRLRNVQVGDEGGRGLHLVDELSTDWGVRTHPQGKTVWFTLGITE